MARYSTTLHTQAPAHLVLDHLADFATLSGVICRRAEHGLRAELVALEAAQGARPE